MTPEAQRIAIAEAVGWKSPTHADTLKVTEGWTLPQRAWMHPNGTIVGVASIPDYLSDLNAMHEAEKSLTIGAQAQYLNQLEEVTGGGKFGTWWECLWCCHHATAAQRAEAFLRALGLWTTEP